MLVFGVTQDYREKKLQRTLDFQIVDTYVKKAILDFLIY